MTAGEVDAGYVIVADRMLDTGGRQITVSLAGLRRLTVRIPASQNTPEGVTAAIVAAISTHPPKPKGIA